MQGRCTGLVALCRDWHSATSVVAKAATAAGRSVHSPKLKRLERCIYHSIELLFNLLIQMCLQIELGQRRIGADVVGIEMFMLPTCAELVRLTNEMCLGGNPLGQVQENTRATPRLGRRGRSGAVAWRGGAGTRLSAAGGEIQL